MDLGNFIPPINENMGTGSPVAPDVPVPFNPDWGYPDCLTKNNYGGTRVNPIIAKKS